MSEDLPRGEAHLWYVRPDALRDEPLLRAYEGLLAEGEKARRDRFRVEPARHGHLVTRALVRCVLSRYTAVPPHAWTFLQNAYGRPEVGAPAAERWLRFNLSHTSGLIVCLVARDVEVGVDVEDATRKVEALAFGKRFFSAAEASSLAGATEATRGERFFQLWTLKESYIKARGMGLTIPLQSFAFAVGGARIDISFAPPSEDDARQWQFTQLRLGRHQIAAAIRSPTPVAVRLREMVPLREG